MPPMSKKPINRRECQSTRKPETRYCAVYDDVSGKTVTRTLLSILISHLLLMGLPAALTSNALAENLPSLAGMTKKPDMNLYLELVANEKPTGHVAPVHYRNKQYWVNTRDLAAAGIPFSPWRHQMPASGDAEIALDDAKDVKVNYDSPAQQLRINVPVDSLPEQTLDLKEKRPFYPPQAGLGMLVNYDIYVQKNRQTGSNTNAWSELRLFSPYGTLANTGIYRHDFSDNLSESQSGYVRYDTRWHYSDEVRILTYEAGDLVTRGLSWNNPVRIGGFQISKNFSVRPDIITYPLPQFSGSAAVPSTLDLYLDGYRAQSNQLNPGPFSITTTPFVNGAGEAVVVTTDALGRQVSTTLPFYVTGELLKKGLTDYAASFGVLRQRYGISSFDYSKLAYSGSLRYGLTDALTVGSHVEGGKSLTVGGLGATARLGMFGVANASYSASSGNGRHGTQWTAGYQYTNRHFNAAAQWVRYSPDWRDLSTTGTWQRPYEQSTQLTAGIPLGLFGSLSGGIFSIKNNDGNTTRLTNLTWSITPGNFGTFYFSANKSNNDSGWSGFIQWILPFGKENRDTVSSTTTRNQQGDYSQRFDYSRTVPTDGGLGWNLGYSFDSSGPNYRQADLTWRNDRMQMRGGFYGPENNNTTWGEMSGALVIMDKSLFATNMVQDSFVLVSTDGVPAIPVRYENNLIGSTDSDGHLMVPSVPGYYAAKYEIDPLNLPLDMQVPEVEKRVAVKSGNGYLMRFPVKQTLPVGIRLVDSRQNPLPAGSVARLASGKISPVGLDGFVWFDDADAENRLTVSLPDGKRCHATFSIDRKKASGTMSTIGPLECLKE